ncbi:MAG: hypothetical protein LBO67_04195 [Spirochaetaceae bacterium]|jgi:hypothetical protein|nr:hypothetical protein [Spirochaetaceae bacterium]
MKKQQLEYRSALIIVLVVCWGCAGKPHELQLPWVGPEAALYITLFEVLDYQGKAEGALMPDWVHQYNYRAIQGIEDMAEYYDSYVFVGINSGKHYNALRLWAEAWTVHQDFALLVMERVHKRLVNAIQAHPETETPVYPDYEYGDFFEEALKAVADTYYNDVLQRAVFWQLKRYFQEDGSTVDREVYEFLVLSSITKEVLEKQIQALFAALPPLKTPLTAQQEAAVKRITEHFFDTF